MSIPAAGDHVLGSLIKSRDVKSVQRQMSNSKLMLRMQGPIQLNKLTENTLVDPTA
jgi:hypothetical protein